MTPRRIVFGMLVTAGVAVGHIAGYAIAHPDEAAREAALGGHAYLPATAAAVIPLGVVAALVWAVQTARSFGLAGQIRFRHLAAAQLGLFAVQEVGERLVGGIDVSAVLVEPGVWLGALAQVAIAFAVTRSIDLARRAVRFVARGGRLLGDQLRPILAPAPHLVPLPARVPVAVGLRAPPGAGSTR